MGPDRVFPAAGDRERVLLATAQLWSESGYEALNPELISSRSGVAPEVLAAMYPTVDAAAAAAIEVPLADVVRIVAEHFSPDHSEAESYARAIVCILDFMAANPPFAYLAYIGGRQMAPPQVHTVFENGHRFLVAMLERLWETSGLTEQPNQAALGALGAAEAVVRREIAAGRYDRLTSLGPDLVYIATVPFLGQKEALRLSRGVES